MTDKKAGEVMKVYSIHPQQKLKIGKFLFERGTLKLETAEEIAEFEELLAKLPSWTRAQIKTISLEAAEALIAEMKRPEAAKGMDSTSAKIGLDAVTAKQVEQGKKESLNAIQAKQTAEAARRAENQKG